MSARSSALTEMAFTMPRSQKVIINTPIVKVTINTPIVFLSS